MLGLFDKKVDWCCARTASRDYNRTSLLSAAGLVTVSFLLLDFYGLLG